MPLLHFNIPAVQQTARVSGGATDLIAIVVNTAAASAVVTVFNGANATNVTSSLDKVATIDASATGNFFYGSVCRNGLTVTLSGGNADVTIVHEPYDEFFPVDDPGFLTE